MGEHEAEVLDLENPYHKLRSATIISSIRSAKVENAYRSIHKGKIASHTQDNQVKDWNYTFLLTSNVSDVYST